MHITSEVPQMKLHYNYKAGLSVVNEIILSNFSISQIASVSAKVGQMCWNANQTSYGANKK